MTNHDGASLSMAEAVEEQGRDIAVLAEKLQKAEDRLAPLIKALSGLVAATANVIDVGPAYDQAVRDLKAAEEAPA